MRVACLDCETRFEIPDDLIDPSGQKVECCRCGLVFGVKAATATAVEIPAPTMTKSALGASFWALALVLLGLVGIYFAKPAFLYATKAPAFEVGGQASGAYYTRPDGKNLFIVSGKVKNASSSRLPCPKVSVKAFGGGIEASAFSYACSAPARDALDQGGTEALASSLQKQSSETLAAGELKPFIVIFPDPPKGLSEFEVEFSGK